jgi:hypothetical protein
LLLIRKGELIIPRDTVLQPADEILAVVHALIYRNWNCWENGSHSLIKPLTT